MFHSFVVRNACSSCRLGPPELLDHGTSASLTGIVRHDRLALIDLRTGPLVRRDGIVMPPAGCLIPTLSGTATLATTARELTGSGHYLGRRFAQSLRVALSQAYFRQNPPEFKADTRDGPNRSTQEAFNTRQSPPVRSLAIFPKHDMVQNMDLSL